MQPAKEYSVVYLYIDTTICTAIARKGAVAVQLAYVLYIEGICSIRLYLSYYGS